MSVCDGKESVGILNLVGISIFFVLYVFIFFKIFPLGSSYRFCKEFKLIFSISSVYCGVQSLVHGLAVLVGYLLYLYWFI